MDFWKKTKNTLEWISLLKLVADIAVAVASWHATRKLMSYVPHISRDWASVFAWIVAAAVMMLLVLWQERKNSSQQQGSSKGQAFAGSALVTTVSPIDVKAILAKPYNSPLQAEVESNLKNVAANILAEERETLMLKFYAMGIVAYGYDTIWWAVFRSQLEALEGLNRKIFRREELEKYYAEAEQKYPQEYAGFSFERWMEFLLKNTLILEVPGNSIGITNRGRDFLKCMIHWGRSVNDRRL